MKAARWHGKGDVRVEEAAIPIPEAHELLLEVIWCGICGSDLEEFLEGPVMIPTEPHPARGTAAPIVLGHEVVGRVHVPAADGTGPSTGTIVVPDVVIGCGECPWCRRHEEGLCPRIAVRGQTEDGGLAQFMVADAASCLVVPDEMPIAHAALVEPASVAVRALRKLDGTIGRRIAVVGAGTIGQLVARTAAASGASVELVVDRKASRRELALLHGARAACAPEDAIAAVRSPDDAYDAVVECSGADGALAMALALTRRGGTVVALGIRSRSELFDSTALVLSEKTLVGSAAHLWDADSRPALDLIAKGRIAVDDLITHRVPLDAVTDGFALLADSATDALKVLIDCR